MTLQLACGLRVRWRIYQASSEFVVFRFHPHWKQHVVASINLHSGSSALKALTFTMWIFLKWSGSWSYVLCFLIRESIYIYIYRHLWTIYWTNCQINDFLSDPRVQITEAIHCKIPSKILSMVKDHLHLSS